ncbi:type 2 lanthipeptide synthetase LanM [Flavobacterium salmonis]|uniref:Lantibiotic biosynthesis protein dehydration domain-containing protein n=1 Tax=Flavobacterium salmonis TaxID=2654844 RepID=A0A6V6Z506_9FLAO|nr:type 2 lanthipeptide synthetase LanM [Flavobacterium salmonis]CAD0006887.1 hypothetical protein FLAT13_03553 [Flavobacterium salmonis]
MNTEATYFIKENFKTIPFVDIIMPYTYSFISNSNIELFILKDKLHTKLLEELSVIAELSLQFELDNFIKNGNDDYNLFVDKMSMSIMNDFPVLDNLLKIKTENFSKHINNIFSRFYKDREIIEFTFNLNDIRIVDIDVSLGDGHKGEGTSMVYLSNEKKLIYKPRNINIVSSYNSFIDWINDKLETDLKTFQILDCGDYGWLEFVNNDEANSKEDLQEYYFKAGMLLAVAFLLGSKDCHRENIIASGKNPVMIDHETIIQPFLASQSVERSWDEQQKIPLFSVLESVLIVNSNTKVPIDCTGYGVRGNLHLTDFGKKIVNPNTINSKRVTRFVTRELVGKNIPVYNENRVFVNDYAKNFVDGFSLTYDLFTNSKEELKSLVSPINSFKNQEVRYVWRPTFVYFNILRYMRSPALMSSHKNYNSKLKELLSKAYFAESMKSYKFIMDYEIQQMLNGDIPIFSLSSLDDYLEGNESFKIFEYNCIDNINKRIDILSPDHKKDQLEFIHRWVTI